MLKHVSATTLTRRRAASPAPSSASISTLESSGSSASSTCSSPSSSSSVSSCHLPGTSSSISSACSDSSDHSTSNWRSLAECRTYSRLSVTEHPNAVPLRVYAATLRPDIQYKTIGVTSTTTCEEVIGALLTKCKVRFKDPRLFQLSMEVEIRCPDGCNTRASIKLEDRAIPLHLQECYPRGQAKFILETRTGTLVKIFDESNTVGWQYKSVLISEKTTASELLDVLFRFTSKTVEDVHFYALHLETKDRRRPLAWNECIVPARDAAAASQSTSDQVRIVLKSQAILPFGSIRELPTSNFTTNFLRTSTLSLYDNVTPPSPPPLSFEPTSDTSPLTPPPQMETNTLGRLQMKLRRRSKSLSDSLSSVSNSPTSSISPTESFRLISNSRVTPNARVPPNSNSRAVYSSPFNFPTITESVLATLSSKFGSGGRYGKYDLSVSEAFFV